MLLKYPLKQVFDQLSESLNQLSDAEYTKPVKSLANASIGQHVRHVVELFQCLLTGYDGGVVNYDHRKRDFRIETDRTVALLLLKSIYENLDQPNKDLILETEDYTDTKDAISIPSNYFRELVYNLEHSIHHMALIRVGIHKVSQINLPADFGVAYSTIKYREQCAQ